MDNKVFEKAIAFAVQAHAGQKRKDGAAYILHPLEDAVIVATMTDDPEVLAAAVLHDTVEDTPVTAEEIEANFGARVATLVAHETEDKMPHLAKSESWRRRKEESLAVLRECNDTASKMLWLGDKLSNMRSLARDYAAMGEAVFDRFNEKNPKEQRWYHATILEYISELKDCPAYREYEHLFHTVFDKYA